MTRFKGLLKIGLLAGILFAAVFIFAGCGEVETEMEFDTEFSGQRTMTVYVSPNYLGESYIEGGQTALEVVIDENVPSVLKYTKSEETENDFYMGYAKYTFVLSFTSLEDYVAQCNTLLEMTESTEVESAEVVFVESTSDFVNGFSYEENFSTTDLLGWLQDAMGTADITYGDTYLHDEYGMVLIYDGKEYDAYNRDTNENGSYVSKMKIEDIEYNTFSNLSVNTYMEYDGTYIREFEFTMPKDTLEKLEEKEFSLEKYFQGVVAEMPVEAELIIVENEDGNSTTCTIIFNAATAEEIVVASNVILKNEKTIFEIAIEEAEGAVTPITIKDYIDASHYINYSKGEPHSRIIPYAGAQCVSSKGTSNVTNSYIEAIGASGVEYNVKMGDPVTLVFNWGFRFPQAEVSFELSSNISAEINYYLPTNAQENIVEMAKNYFNAVDMKGVSHKTSKDEEKGMLVYTVSFSKGDAATVSPIMNDYLYELQIYHEDEYGYSSTDVDIYIEMYYDEIEGGFITKEYIFEAFTNDLDVISPGKVTLVAKTGMGAEFLSSANKKAGEASVDVNAAYKADLVAKLSVTSIVPIIAIAIIVLMVIVAAVVVMLYLKKAKAAQLPQGQYGVPQGMQNQQYAQWQDPSALNAAPQVQDQFMPQVQDPSALNVAPQVQDQFMPQVQDPSALNAAPQVQDQFMPQVQDPSALNAAPQVQDQFVPQVQDPGALNAAPQVQDQFVLQAQPIDTIILEASEVDTATQSFETPVVGVEADVPIPEVAPLVPEAPPVTFVEPTIEGIDPLTGNNENQLPQQ